MADEPDSGSPITGIPSETRENRPGTPEGATLPDMGHLPGAWRTGSAGGDSGRRVPEGRMNRTPGIQLADEPESGRIHPPGGWRSGSRAMAIGRRSGTPPRAGVHPPGVRTDTRQCEPFSFHPGKTVVTNVGTKNQESPKIPCITGTYAMHSRESESIA